MNQFEFNSVELPNVQGVSDPVPIRLGSFTTPMRIGGHTSTQFADIRKINVQCVYLPTAGQDFSDLELAFATFCSNMYNAGSARLSLRKNWFYLARIANINTDKKDPGSIEFDVDFHLDDPRQFKIGPNTDGSSDVESTIAVTWGTNFTTPAGLETPIKMYLVTSGGYVASLQMTPTYPGSVVGDSLTWAPTAAGTTIVDFENQSASRSGVDVTDEFTGDFFTFAPGTVSMKIDTVPSSGQNIAATLYYREARF
jgi:hypothetical protein